MKEAIKVFVCSHNHVPYGASHDIYENNYIQNIKPFITALYRYPRVPALLHYSGPVYEYLLQEHGEFFMLLEELVNRKQVEILGGGYYE
ncbi:MAG: alpha-amylase, partial [Breznakiellaceae bacterium]